MHYIEIIINTPLRDVVGPSKDRLESDDLNWRFGAVWFDNVEENVEGWRDEWVFGKASSILDFDELDDRKGGVPPNNKLLYWGEWPEKGYSEDDAYIYTR